MIVVVLMVRVMIVTIVVVFVIVVVVVIIVVVIVIVVVRHWCVIGTRDRNLLAIAASYLSFSSGNESYQGF